MEDGVEVRGCVGEEARPGRNVWGGWLPIVWGGILIDKKIERWEDPWPSMAAVWWGDTTTNLKLASTVEGALKRRGNRSGTCGGGCLFAWSGESTKEKNTTTKVRRGLRRLPTNENHTTTNQKHAGVTKEVRRGVATAEGSVGEVRIDRLGAIKSGSISN